MQDRSTQLNLDELEKRVKELEEKLKEQDKKLQAQEKKLQQPLNGPLLQAAAQGDENKIEHLRLCGAEVDAKDENGTSALQLAVLNRHIKVAVYLAGHGANWASVDNNKHTILHLLFLNNILEDIDDVLLHYPHENIFSTFSEIYQMANNQDTKEVVANKMLLVAAKQSNLEVATQALQLGAKVDAQNKYSETALHKACGADAKDVVQLLLENNYSTEIEDNGHCKPVERATDNNVIKLIFDYKLLRAVKAQNNELIDEMLKNDFDLNKVKDLKGTTPLHIAVSLKNTELVTKLLLKGANPSVQNTDNETPLHIAAKMGLTDIAKLLIKGSILIKGNDGSLEAKTVIDAANKARSEQPELANKILLSFGKEKQLQKISGSSDPKLFADKRVKEKLEKTIKQIESEQIVKPFTGLMRC